VLGVLLVAMTTLLGARLLSSADQTVSVWQANRALPAGTRITADDLETTRVRFTSDEVSALYVPADSKLEGMVVTRQLAPGEFVPRDATADQLDADRTEVPLSVQAGRLPADLGVGDQVDVWVVPKRDSGGKEQDPPAERVWEKVRVIQVDAAKGVAGSSARRQVLVTLDKEQTGKLSRGLAQVGNGEPVLVRRGR
jgi:Flp pilus assembly protein CpaB